MSTTTANREKSPGTVSPVDIPLGMLPLIELPADQIQRAFDLAENRNQSYKSIEGGDVFGANDSLTSHQIGLLGELAVGLAYQSEIDAETYQFGDGGTDLTLWGRSVDVKSTATQKMDLPQLLVRADSELKADIYVRAHVVAWGPSGAQIRLLGYAPRARVIDREPHRHPGSVKNYVVEPAELTLLPWTGHE